ncbi:hypothetical protein [Catellatospora tritici]|uniref:hypothetical protein n=1 Tax=Catellatospora tritici TaxID=2851566 RepID=UPI001C2D6685|nr:hypothetical protein [Catellatospora tritici]MBV1849838.1 hypothetical protein [Catellatospora tritici]
MMWIESTVPGDLALESAGRRPPSLRSCPEELLVLVPVCRHPTPRQDWAPVPVPVCRHPTPRQDWAPVPVPVCRQDWVLEGVS